MSELFIERRETGTEYDPLTEMELIELAKTNAKLGDHKGMEKRIKELKTSWREKNEIDKKKELIIITEIRTIYKEWYNKQASKKGILKVTREEFMAKIKRIFTFH